MLSRRAKAINHELGTKRFAPSMVSGSSPVVAHMMATGGLHGR
jgi:hypothetical protein